MPSNRLFRADAAKHPDQSAEVTIRPATHGSTAGWVHKARLRMVVIATPYYAYVVSFSFPRRQSLLTLRGCCDPVAPFTCWSATAKKAAVVAAYYQPGQAVGAACRRDNSIRL